MNTGAESNIGLADFRPAASTDAKLKRADLGEKTSLELVANPDILAQTVSLLSQEESKPIVIGFAAEVSDELEKLGRKKLLSKGCDYIVANNIGSGKVFGRDETEVVLVYGDSAERISGTKIAVATGVLSKIASNMGES
jgi:phosphopantothenoylcysteine decarboxylase/phosphopantothenate--cysteine ligase